MSVLIFFFVFFLKQKKSKEIKSKMEGIVRSAIDTVVNKYLSKQYEGEVKVHSQFLSETDQALLFSVCLGLERGINFHLLQDACNNEDQQIAIDPDLRCWGKDTNIRFYLALRKMKNESKNKDEV
jgi:hypothetical protein